MVARQWSSPGMAALNSATSQDAALLQTAVDGIGGIDTALADGTATLGTRGAPSSSDPVAGRHLRTTAGIPGAWTAVVACAPYWAGRRP